MSGCGAAHSSRGRPAGRRSDRRPPTRTSALVAPRGRSVRGGGATWGMWRATEGVRTKKKSHPTPPCRARGGPRPRTGQFTEKRPRGRPRGCKPPPAQTCAATRISKARASTTSLVHRTHTHAHRCGAAHAVVRRLSVQCCAPGSPLPRPHELHTHTPQPAPGCVAHTHTQCVAPHARGEAASMATTARAGHARFSPRDTPYAMPAQPHS